jgi:NDP-sugar pyrophosphorylase family protein
MLVGGLWGMQALILAGGEGARMRQVTNHVPKPLLYLPGGTLLEHHLTQLARLPVTETFVVTRHGEERIGRALGGREAVTQIRQDAPFTLLGALASAESLITRSFIVVHGDNYFSAGLGYFTEAAQSAVVGSGSRAVFLTESAAQTGDRAAHLAFTGCYMLSPGVFSLVRTLWRRDELRFLTTALVESGVPLGGVPMRGWRANINEVGDLLAVSRRLLEEWPDSFHPPGAGKGWNRTEGCVSVNLPVWVSLEAEVVDCDLGPFAVVGPRAAVRHSVLRNTIVFPEARADEKQLEGAIVLPAADGSLVLASQNEIHRHQEGHGQKEPPQLSPAAKEQQHPCQEKAGKSDDVD